MTFLEAVNAVLRRLREDEVVSTNATDYSKLVGDFVNQAMYDVENAWDWKGLRRVLSLDTVVGEAQYELKTDGTINPSDLASERLIIREVYNDTQNWRLKLAADPDIFRYVFGSNSRDTGSPYRYWIRNVAYLDDETRLQLQLDPVPDKVDTLRLLITAYTPFRKLDGTDDALNFYVASHPIVLGAYATAVSERGEDGGIGYAEADMKYREALSDAIALDASLAHWQEVSYYVV